MTPSPDKDAVELLDADHLAVKHLFVEYARLAVAEPGNSTSQRTELATRICDDITVHAQIEEEIFYPALRDASPDAAELLDEAEKEHDKAKQLIAQIQALGTASPEMDDLVAKLAAAIEHHVKEERDQLFPKARASDLDLAELATQLQERQQALQVAA